MCKILHPEGSFHLLSTQKKRWTFWAGSWSESTKPGNHGSEKLFVLYRLFQQNVRSGRGEGREQGKNEWTASQWEGQWRKEIWSKQEECSWGERTPGWGCRRPVAEFGGNEQWPTNPITRRSTTQTFPVGWASEVSGGVVAQVHNLQLKPKRNVIWKPHHEKIPLLDWNKS